MGIFRGKHTFREEAGRGAGGGGGVWRSGGPQGPRTSQTKSAGPGAFGPGPRAFQGAKRPAAAPPGAPWATAHAKKAGGSPAWGMGHASRVVSWPSSAAGAEGGVRRPGRGGGGLGSGPPEGENAPLIA